MIVNQRFKPIKIVIQLVALTIDIRGIIYFFDAFVFFYYQLSFKFITLLFSSCILYLKLLLLKYRF
jgi:hypothetical protein